MRTGKISTIDKQELQRITNDCTSISEILRQLNLHPSSGNFRSLKKKLEKEQINFTHIQLGRGANKGRSFPSKKIPLEIILVENSTYENTNFLKKRLLKEGLLKNECYKCGIPPLWNSEILSLQIDHINGLSSDNRLANLRILCPNCHSQTSTYAGKQNKKEKIKKHRPTKIIWPTHEKLEQMVHQSNYVQVGLLLGVSDNAVRKRINRGTPVENRTLSTEVLEASRLP